MVCPVCNHENDVLSFYCESCYHLLSDKNALLFNEDVKNLLEETSDKNIFKYGNIFLILKDFNNNLLNFGEFFNFDDALDKKTEIGDNGWPIPMNLIDDGEETISNNIFKRDGKYYVFNIVEGKKKIFGKYSSKKEATLAKYSFIKNNWGKSKDDGLPKYIYTTPAGTFRISRRLFGKEIRFGTFPTLEDATFVKSLLNDKNWKISNFDDKDCIYENEGLFYIIKKNSSGKLKIFGKYDSLDEAKIYNNIGNKTKRNKNNLESKYGTNIYKVNDNKFTIQKSISGIQCNFGVFPSVSIAQFVKKVLESNNWDVNYFKNNNIFEIDGKFHVFKLVRDHPKLMGVFGYLQYAEEYLDNFDDSNILENSEKFIYKQNNKFFIQKNLNHGTFKAKFDDLELAKTIRDFLINIDWNMDYFNNLDNIFKINDKFYVFYKVHDLRLDILEVFNTYVDALESKNNLINAFKENFNEIETRNGDKHIHKSNRGYSVVKRIDGILTSFGTFNTREEAIAVRDELIANNWNLDYSHENSEDSLNSDVLNEIIFRLDPWEKIVFDAINELNSDKFTFDDLKQFENKFKRFTTPDKMESKVLKNLNSLTQQGLLVKTG